MCTYLCIYIYIQYCTERETYVCVYVIYIYGSYYSTGHYDGKTFVCASKHSKDPFGARCLFAYCLLSRDIHACMYTHTIICK